MVTFSVLGASEGLKLRTTIRAHVLAILDLCFERLERRKTGNFDDVLVAESHSPKTRNESIMSILHNKQTESWHYHDCDCLDMQSMMLDYIHRR